MDAVVQLNAALAGRYDVEREIGAGGMATVYLARDVRHDRKVALKVLNAELGAILGVERFLSEIKVTANLQHPNLLPLFDSGEAGGLLFYVMPYVEGESLRARLDRETQLPVDDAVRIATSIAEALEYAHGQGVIHRDLKPENILLHAGQPLIADFGIALAVSNAGGGRITQTGLSLGTPQYMSPEQATGDRTIDGRTDIYSLGAMLYEMLVGDPPHLGGTSQAIIAKVLTDKPRAVRASRPNVPPHVDAAIERALEKLAADRFATAHEFAEALGGRGPAVSTHAAATGVASGDTREASLGWRAVLRHPVTIGAFVVALAGWASFAWLRPVPDGGGASTTVRFPLVLAEGEGSVLVAGVPFAIAPDGGTYVYSAGATGASRLYIRRANQTSSRAILESDQAQFPSFSPDGKSLAFISGRRLMRIRTDAGGAVLVADVPSVLGTGWGRDAIVLGRGVQGGLRAVSPAGRAVTELTTPDSASSESHRYPVVLADGATVLFTVWTGNASTARIGVTSLDSRETTILDIAGIGPLGVVAGLLVYHDARGSLLGVPFDAKRRRVTGEPRVLVDSVSFAAPVGGVRAALSHSGSLAYLVGGGAANEAELVAVGLDGRERTVVPLRRRYLHPRYSPDGRKIAVVIAGDSISEIWIYDIASGTLSPLTRGVHAMVPEWSRDGSYVMFRRGRQGESQLWRQVADGSSPAELVQASAPVGEPVQGVVTPDGRHLIYRSGYGPTSDDLWYRALDGSDTVSKAFAAERSFNERNPSLSADGRWVAYASNESGSYQLYVRPFPGPGPRYPVTVDGGDSPVWSRDGRTLYYIADTDVEAATIVTAPQFQVSRRKLFERRFVTEEWHRNYDLARDGSHFLAVRSTAASGPAARAMIIHNWAADLRALNAARSAR